MVKQTSFMMSSISGSWKISISLPGNLHFFKPWKTSNVQAKMEIAHTSQKDLCSCSQTIGIGGLLMQSSCPSLAQQLLVSLLAKFINTGNKFIITDSKIY